MAGPGDGGASSSATTNISCSRSAPPNAICSAPGWTHILSHGTDNLSWNEPSTAVITSRVTMGCFSGATEPCDEEDSSVRLSSESYKDGSAAYRETRMIRFDSTEDQKGWSRVSRFACHRRNSVGVPALVGLGVSASPWPTLLAMDGGRQLDDSFDDMDCASNEGLVLSILCASCCNRRSLSSRTCISDSSVISSGRGGKVAPASRSSVDLLKPVLGSFGRAAKAVRKGIGEGTAQSVWTHSLLGEGMFCPRGC